MKDLTMKKISTTNPAKEGYVAVTSVSDDMGAYLRKVNGYKS